MNVKNIYKINVVFGIGLLTTLILLSVGRFINPDASYYLSLARDINDGNVLYRDIINGYTPFSMYLNSIWYALFKTPPFDFLVYFQIFIILITGFVYYLIQRKLNVKKSFSIFMSLLYILASVELEGYIINLEVYCLLFLMLAYLSLLYKKYFITGVFISLCFLSKQYGILNAIPFLLLIIFYQGNSKNVLLPILKFVLGGISIGIIFIFYFVILNEVDLINLIQQISGKSYASAHFKFGFEYYPFFKYSRMALLLIAITFFLTNTKDIKRLSYILIGGYLINLLPTFIQNFGHYYLLPLPYAFLFFSNNVKFEQINKNISCLFFAIIMFSLSLLNFKSYKYRNYSKQQSEIANKAQQIYPIGSEVFLDGNLKFLYIKNNYRNPLINEIGYSFFYDLDTLNTTEINILRPQDLDSIKLVEPDNRINLK